MKKQPSQSEYQKIVSVANRGKKMAEKFVKANKELMKPSKDTISFCPSCNSMTHIKDELCGKCGKPKKKLNKKGICRYCEGYSQGYKDGSGGISADVLNLHDQYEKGKKDALTKAIELFDKFKDEPMTSSVVILELEVLKDKI